MQWIKILSDAGHEILQRIRLTREQWTEKLSAVNLVLKSKIFDILYQQRQLQSKDFFTLTYSTQSTFGFSIQIPYNSISVFGRQTWQT